MGVGLGTGPVKNQEELLVAISVAKEALKAKGTPMRFIVERLGTKPTGPKVGDTVLVQGKPGKITTMDPRTSSRPARQFCTEHLRVEICVRVLDVPLPFEAAAT